MAVYMLIVGCSLGKRDGKEQESACARGESSGSHMWIRDLYVARSGQVEECGRRPFRLLYPVKRIFGALARCSILRVVFLLSQCSSIPRKDRNRLALSRKSDWGELIMNVCCESKERRRGREQQGHSNIGKERATAAGVIAVVSIGSKQAMARVPRPAKWVNMPKWTGTRGSGN